MRAPPAIRRLKEWLKIKLYAEGLRPSRRILRPAEQRGHFVFEVLKPALGRGRRRRRRWLVAGSGAGRGRLRRDGWRDRLGGRAAKCRLEPLRHLGEILVGRGHPRRGRRRRWWRW